MAEVIIETFNRLTGRSTVVERDEGELLFIRHQDTRAITESAKRLASNFDPLVKRDTVHVARLPINIWWQLEQLGITKDEKAFNAWLDDPDNAVFRTDNRSKL